MHKHTLCDKVHIDGLACPNCARLYGSDVIKSPDPLADQAAKFPAYWRRLPENWEAIDYYRIRSIFPLPAGCADARLDHALKKLLIPGIRTGSKSFFKDLEEAHATLGQWLADNQHMKV